MKKIQFKKLPFILLIIGILIVGTVIGSFIFGKEINPKNIKHMVLAAYYKAKQEEKENRIEEQKLRFR